MIKHYDEYHVEFDKIFRYILREMISDSPKPIRLRKINPSMYQKALDDFMKFGEITRYPTKYIHQWKNIVIENVIFLDVTTMLFGHAEHFNTDIFDDVVLNTDETGESVSDWGEAMEYIEENGYDEVLDKILPKWSNGHNLISDYGLEPLYKIVKELIETDDVNKILVLINKALDISHQRSDLSELFIQGGAASLNRISGVNETIIKLIKEELFNLIYE